MSTGPASPDWQRLRSLFHKAVDWPEDEREARLDAVCGDDRALRDELDALLRASSSAASFLESPLADLRTPTAADGEPDDALLMSRHVGAYALERLLGHGGMGAVYLAVRADDAYRAQVAIKVVRPDLVTPELVERFRAERQILADLHHPHIAQLLDGGTTDDGRPYLVMEYVDGEPIDRHCDGRAATFDERVRLFVKVCRAVHVAHQSLVVHRDIKPAHLLITREGEPKLLDFGVAKLLPPPGQGGPADGLTRGAAPMTLDYASPEQVLRRPITTASDVYALGVVLFELLVGCRPLALATAPPDEQLAMLRSRAAPRASEVASKGDGDAATRRATTRGRLVRALRGDLDTVLAKALHKDPRRRYPSAEDLAQDLERHLSGMAVRARGDSLFYRAGKFVGRHRLAVAATALVMWMLSALSVALWIERGRAVQQRERATRSAMFLLELFDLSNPDAFYGNRELLELYPEAQRGADVTARDILDAGARRLGAGLEDQPEVQAEVMSTIGWAYHHLGAYRRAAEQLDWALGIARRAAGEDSLLAATIRIRLGAVRRAQARYDEAEALLRAARDGVSPAADRAAEVRALALSELAEVASRRGDMSSARAYLGAVATESRKLYGADDPRMARVLVAQGDLARETGDGPAAHLRYAEARAILRARYGDRHPRLAALQHDLALLYQQEGDLASAEAAYREALAMQRAMHGAEHPSIARSLHNLAHFMLGQGRFDEASPLAEEALVMRRGIYGDAHPLIGLSLNLRGLIHSGLGAFVAAEEDHRQALALWTGVIDPEHGWIASAHNNLGRALVGQRQWNDARQSYQQALALYQRRYDGPHYQTARVLSNLGALLRQADDLDAALPYYEQALAMQRSLLDDDHPDLLATLNNLAVALLALERPAEAEPLAREVVQTYAGKLGDESLYAAGFRITLGRALNALGRFDDAAAELEKSKAVLDESLPAGHAWRQKADEALADARSARGR